MELKSIDDVEAKLLLTASQRIFSNTTYPRLIDYLQIDGKDVSALASSLTFEGGVALVSCELRKDDTDLSNFLPLFQEVWDVSIEARTSEGEVFSAPRCYYSDSYIGHTPYDSIIRVTFKIYEWYLNPQNIKLWVGHLEYPLPADSDNLKLAIINRFYSRSHFCLNGSLWRYFLLNKYEKTNQPYRLLVSTNESDVDIKVLNKELKVLSFCLGYPIKVGFMAGLDEVGNLSGCLGGKIGFNRLQRNHIFLPTPVSSAWFTVLFNKISNFIAEGSDKQHILLHALELYIGASAEVDLLSLEIKTLLSCAAISHCFVDPIPNLIHTDSVSLWNSWLSENSEYINSLANSEYGDLLEYKIKHSFKPNIIEIIKLSIKKAELASHPIIVRAIEESYKKTLGYEVNLGSDDIDVILKRCSILRILFTGLLGKLVDYSGPISNMSDVPDWWHEGSESPLEYKAEVLEVFPLAQVSELWPTFKLPIIPQGSLLKVIENFALGLTARTGGRVRAKLVPLPVASESETMLYDFTFESIAYPLANTVLFTIRQETQTSPIEILNWGEEAHARIMSEKELVMLLNEVARSKQTKNIVERLMVIQPYE